MAVHFLRCWASAFPAHAQEPGYRAADAAHRGGARYPSLVTNVWRSRQSIAPAAGSRGMRRSTANQDQGTGSRLLGLTGIASVWSPLAVLSRLRPYRAELTSERAWRSA